MRERVEGLLSLDDVVRELLDAFRSKGDWPASHRCVKTLGYDPGLGYDPANVCRHQAFATASLLARLVDLVPPSGSTFAPPDSDRQPTRRSGSPAPWSAAPAELVDEILLGALAMNSRMRQRLGYLELPVKRRVTRPGYENPAWHPPLAVKPYTVTVTQWASKVPKHEAGRAALADLPRLLPRLQETFPEDPDANGPPVKASEPWRGRRWGKVEATVRYWHRQARLLTGHEVDQRLVVHRLPNPHSSKVTGKIWPGPTHENPNDCGDASCWLWHLTRSKAHLPLRCPHCGTLGLVQDDATGALFCDRPSCRDAVGARHEWALDVIFELLSLDGGELE